MKILITGGAGYIGSTVATALEQTGHVPVLLDDLSSGPRAFVNGFAFYEGDFGDRALLRRIVDEHPDLDSTVHCGARIVVPESVREPYAYYDNNMTKSLTLFDELTRLGRTRMVFSSSGSIYAPSETFEVTEESPLAPTSPYARTKLMVELALADLCAATDLRAIMLRYFNPIGSDPGFRTGIHDPLPSHVLGRLVAATRGDLDAFEITGTDLPTRDGTGIRDYIHVWDLARAHVAALERFDDVLAAQRSPSSVINVGTGRGTTVREMVEAFERVHGAQVPVTEGPGRPGDAIGAYANVDKAAALLGWRSELNLDGAIASALEWGRRRGRVLGTG
jgi:UDP-glucose 4-epimerase